MHENIMTINLLPEAVKEHVTTRCQVMDNQVCNQVVADKPKMYDKKVCRSSREAKLSATVL